MLAFSSGSLTPTQWTPKRVADEAQVLAVLRQELRNSHEDPDGNTRPAVEPVHRTVDAETLRVLRHLHYPYILCEDAPAMYRAPMPYDSVVIAEDLTRRLQIFEEHLQTVHRTRLSNVNGSGKQGESHNAKAAESEKEDLMDFFLSVLGHNADFTELTGEVSVLRWYLRWVASHSLSTLYRVGEQIHYVLSEFGVPDAAALDSAAQSVSFSSALETISADRREAVEAERRRMTSRTRTFRTRLAPVAITAATSSYLSTEEKYRFQEYYTETEHVLELLRQALQVQCASEKKKEDAEGPIVNSRATSLAHGLLPRDDGNDCKKINSDVCRLVELAMYKMRRERVEIDALLRLIRRREMCGAVFGITNEAHKRSRSALAAVYKRVMDDMAMFRAHVQAGASFLAHYDAWLAARCGCDHFALIARLPLPQLCGESLILSASAAPAPKHVEDVCRPLLESLSRVCRHSAAAARPEALLRRWTAVALRHTVLQIARGRWPAEGLCAEMDDIALRLAQWAAATVDGGSAGVSPGAAAARAVEFANVMRTFLRLALSAPRDSAHLSSCSVRVALRGEESADGGLWGAMFDALSQQWTASDASLTTLLLHADHIALPTRSSVSDENRNSSSGGSAEIVTIRYVLHDAAPTARSLADIVRESAGVTASTSVVMRYGYVRRVLQALSLFERKKLLLEYACGPQETDLVPLENIVFFARQPPTPSQKTATLMGLLPPAAVRLVRRSATATRADPAGTNRSVSVASVARLIGNMLCRVATCGMPALEAMRALGETARKRTATLAEVSKEGTAPYSSSSGENGNDNDNVVRPLLRGLDDCISTPDFDAVLERADAEIAERSHAVRWAKVSPGEVQTARK